MIDVKKMREAADEYVRDGIQQQIAYKAFKAGVSWFKKCIWHDAKKDRPKHKAICLCWDTFMIQYRVLMYDDEAKYWCDAIFDVGEHMPTSVSLVGSTLTI